MVVSAHERRPAEFISEVQAQPKAAMPWNLEGYRAIPAVQELSDGFPDIGRRGTAHPVVFSIPLWIHTGNC